MRRSRKRNKQRKIIILSTICLLCVMTAGYAAFQTNLNITAKGNIKEMTAAEYLKKTVVTSGEGLYKDIYEEHRYVYKGSNPDNYIEFNNELWRITAIESDNESNTGALKIVKKDSIGRMAWDTSNSNNWLRPSTINTYLNDTYYNDNSQLSSDSKALIQIHSWNIGLVTPNNADLNSQIASENSVTWNGSIGLLSVSDVLRANTNTTECGNLGLNNSNKDICKTTNYLFPTSGYSCLISSSSETLDDVFCTAYTGNIGRDDATNSGGVYPAIYLKSNIKIEGKGTEQNPYTIK